MKRRDFLKTTAAVAGAAAFGAPLVARAQSGCPRWSMSATWSASACRRCSLPMPPATSRTRASTSSSSSCPIPATRITALVSNAMDIIHNPFTNAFVAAGAGCADAHHRRQRRRRAVPHRAEGDRHQEHGGPRGRQGQGPQDRHHALQHVRAHALSRAREADNLAYSDYNIVWFNDTLSMAAAFEAKAARRRHPCRAVRDPPGRSARRRAARQQPRRLGPARSRLRDQHLGAAILESQPEAIGATSRRCCAPTPPSRPTCRRRSRCSTPRKYYRVDKATLTAALPRQMPQVDITKGGDKGMEIAIADMVQLGYLKSRAARSSTPRCSSRHWADDGTHRRARWRRCRGRRAAGRASALLAVGWRPCSRRSRRGRSSSSIWEWAAAAGWSGAVLFPPPSVLPELRDRERLPGRLRRRRDDDPGRDRRQRAARARRPRHRFRRGGRHRHPDLGVGARSPTW